VSLYYRQTSLSLSAIATLAQGTASADRVRRSKGIGLGLAMRVHQKRTHRRSRGSMDSIQRLLKTRFSSVAGSSCGILDSFAHRDA
jgi:hypothetical protein